MEVWLFPKGRPKPGDEVKQGNVYKLIYVFKRISLAALWWKDGKKVRVKMRDQLRDGCQLGENGATEVQGKRMALRCMLEHSNSTPRNDHLKSPHLVVWALIFHFYPLEENSRTGTPSFFVTTPSPACNICLPQRRKAGHCQPCVKLFVPGQLNQTATDT